MRRTTDEEGRVIGERWGRPVREEYFQEQWEWGPPRTPDLEEDPIWMWSDTEDEEMEE